MSDGLCVTGCGNVAVKNGFCSKCVGEVERDIAFQDILPTRSKRAASDARVRADDARVRGFPTKRTDR